MAETERPIGPIYEDEASGTSEDLLYLLSNTDRLPRGEGEDALKALLDQLRVNVLTLADREVAFSRDRLAKEFTAIRQLLDRFDDPQVRAEYESKYPGQQTSELFSDSSWSDAIDRLPNMRVDEIKQLIVDYSSHFGIREISASLSGLEVLKHPLVRLEMELNSYLKEKIRIENTLPGRIEYIRWLFSSQNVVAIALELAQIYQNFSHIAKTHLSNLERSQDPFYRYEHLSSMDDSQFLEWQQFQERIVRFLDQHLLRLKNIIVFLTPQFSDAILDTEGFVPLGSINPIENEDSQSGTLPGVSDSSPNLPTQLYRTRFSEN